MKAKVFLITMFAALTIGAVSVSAEEITEPIENIDTTITNEEPISETEESIESDILLGDVDSNGILNVRDAAVIARMLAYHQADKLDPKTADFNKDGIVNVCDASCIAQKLAAKRPKVKVKQPEKSSYDLNTDKGRVNYINDMLTYIAKEKYHAKSVTIDNSIDPRDDGNGGWVGSWYVPTEYIPNEEYYSTHTSGEQFGFEGCFPICYCTTVDQAIEGTVIGNFDAISNCTVYDEMLDMQVSLGDLSDFDITIVWKPLDNGGNYEIFILY